MTDEGRPTETSPQASNILEELDEAAERQARAALRHKAFDLLSRREHSRAELARKLRARDFDREAVEVLLDALVEERLVCDERFAEAFCEYRMRRGQGPLKIRAELRERGVADSVVQAVLDGDDASWNEVAKLALLKRFGESLSTEAREVARFGRFLAARGFSRRQAFAAIRTLQT